jgi:hypothetical protein
MGTKRSLRFFNTTGPCNPDDHYMLPPEDRLVGAQLHRYISDKLYWVLHAPRQTGKTTFLLSWMREINSGDQAVARYVSVERCQGLMEIERAIPAICSSIRERAQKSALPIPEVTTVHVSSILSNILLNRSALVVPKPLIVLFDEVDVLQGEAFPHLLLMAFLQRVLNGGGHIEREYAAGRGRMDLSIEYNGHWYIIEIKLIHYYDSPQAVREEGLEQIRNYRNALAPDAPAYLVIFDRRPGTKEKFWDERISWEQDCDVAVLEC